MREIANIEIIDSNNRCSMTPDRAIDIHEKWVFCAIMTCRTSTVAYSAVIIATDNPRELEKYGYDGETENWWEALMNLEPGKSMQSAMDPDPETARIMVLKSPIGEEVTVHFPESGGEYPCPAYEKKGEIITVIPPGRAIAGHRTNDTEAFMYEVRFEKSVATCTQEMITHD